jgi:chemotaxis protein CheZ
LVHRLVDSSPELVIQEMVEAPVAATVDTHVLSGPQTADKALQQTDVDDLLASLGF